MQSDVLAQPFELLEQGLGVGTPVPAGWEAIVNQPLLILVGLSSVGKTSALDLLTRQGLAFRLLPDRRILVERLIITQMQLAGGEPVRPVNRYERYPYMDKYRERFPGGMGHSLAQLLVDPAQVGPRLIFNGLRGQNEIEYALQALPLARFLVLDAPDIVRIERMLHRNDPHDKIRPGVLKNAALEAQLSSFAALEVAAASLLFTPQQEQNLLDLARSGQITLADLRDKLKIIIEERRSYDPVATIAVLQRLAPQRTLVLDTTQHPPEQVAQAIVAQFS